MSKYQSYDDYRAVCPYYRGARANELLCDGACAGCPARSTWAKNDFYLACWICLMMCGVEGLCDDIDDDHSATKPKRRDEPFRGDAKGCPNCKYADKTENEESCMHCRRSKAFGSDAWQRMPDLWQARNRAEGEEGDECDHAAEGGRMTWTET